MRVFSTAVLLRSCMGKAGEEDGRLGGLKLNKKRGGSRDGRGPTFTTHA